MPRAKASGSANAARRVERRRRQEPLVNPADALERGRRAYARRAWGEAWESLSLADRTAPLGAEDVELLGTSAYMLGRADDLESLERAYHLHLDAGEALRAARCAFWMGMALSIRGEVSRATGWLGRAQRLVERERRDCVERGYLLLPLIFQHESAGDYEAAAAVAADAAEIGERFRDADLFALAVQSQGILLVRLGRVAEGLGLMDEAMVAVTAGELSPIVSGMVYCGVILGLSGGVRAAPRPRVDSGLDALVRGATRPGELHGTCLVHRAEILQLQGAWREALEEARRAVRPLRAGDEQAGGRPSHSPARRGASPARRLCRGRAGVQGCEPRWSGAAAWVGSLAAGSRRRRRCGRRDPPSAGRNRRAAKASGATARLCRDHAGRRRSRAGSRRVRRAGGGFDRLRERHAGGDGGVRTRCVRAGRRRRPGCPGRAAARSPGVAGARGAVRSRTHARARRTRMPRLGRQRHGRVGAGGRPAASSPSSERRRTSPASTRSPRPRTLPTLTG